MGSVRARFGRRELEVLDQALSLAQELTGQHYGLADDWFERTSHQVCTRKDLRPFEVLGPGYLAQIRRVYRIPRDPVWPVPRLSAHYRICLQDHNLLDRLRHEPDVRLADLLVAVLTHEYVHLVRFCRFDCPYQDPARLREAEEVRVNRLVREILRAAPKRLRETADRLFPTGRPGRV